MIFLWWIVQIVLAPALSPLCLGVVKKLKARLQNRQGASIFQPYQDLWKLLHKDEIVSRDASWIFRFAPYVIFSVTIIVGASIPLFAVFLNNIFTSDFLMVIYTLSIGTFFLALAGIDTGSGFGGFGSSREMTIFALAEAGFIFSLLTVALVAHTTDLFTIAGAGVFSMSRYTLPVILSFIGFFIVLLAETSRFPFDNPATHLELTMIHEAMILEYSGKRLALMEWASANKFFIFAALGANLFFPWGIAQNVTVGAVALGTALLIIKILVFCIAIAVIESSMAKFRFFRLPDLLMVSFILSVAAISLIHLS
jgi:formate hydrogenlyase subunit 4